MQVGTSSSDLGDFQITKVCQAQLRQDEKTVSGFLKLHNRKQRKVKPDGNCFYRAAALQLFGKESLHHKLRLFLANVVRTNADHYSNFFIEKPGHTFLRHKETIHQTGVWATQVEFFAIAEAFGIPVYLCSPNTSTKMFSWEKYHGFQEILTPSLAVYGLPPASTPLAQKDQSHIEVAHNSTRDHFDSIAPAAATTLLTFPQNV